MTSPSVDDEVESDLMDIMDPLYLMPTKHRLSDFRKSPPPSDDGEDLTQRRRKLRKTGKESAPQATQVDDSQTPVTTANRFDVLRVEADAADEAPIATVRKYKIPPIIVKPMRTHGELINFIKNAVTANFSVKPSGAFMKVSLSTPDDYRSVTTLMVERNIEHHTWNLEPKKHQRFVVRGLPKNADPDDILTELQEMGYNATAVIQLTGTDRETGKKRAFPLFTVTLVIPHGEAPVDFTDIEKLQHCCITTEKPRERNGPIQCYRCQRIGHKSAYCHHAVRCVCCGGSHDAKVCPLEKSAAAICANCKGSHPACIKDANT